MSNKILAQDELDELLRALSTGEVEVDESITLAVDAISKSMNIDWSVKSDEVQPHFPNTILAQDELDALLRALSSAEIPPVE